METQPSEASLNNARRILAQIENLRDTTGAPTLRKMWTDGTISYEFTVDEAHSRIRVWGEDLSFTGFLFTYPEAGFWGVGYKKETPKYKKRPPPKILAGELDWQGIGGKLSWKGLSRYFGFSAGSSWGLPGQYLDPGIEPAKGYHSAAPDPYTNARQYSETGNGGGPNVYMDGKVLCTIVPVFQTYISVTCAVLSPDKKKILIGYAGYNAEQNFGEIFIMLPLAVARGDVSLASPGIITTAFRNDYYLGASTPYGHAFTEYESEFLWGNITGMWRFNASGSIGYGERRATRQRINVEWIDDAETITITAEGKAWTHRNVYKATHVEKYIVRYDHDNSLVWTTDYMSYRTYLYASESGLPLISSQPLHGFLPQQWVDIESEWVLDSSEPIEDPTATWSWQEVFVVPGYYPYLTGYYHEATFCDFDWDTPVEGRIEYRYENDTTGGTGGFNTQTTFTTTVTIDDVVVHNAAYSAVASATYWPDGTPYPRETLYQSTSKEGGGTLTFFHWIDLRVKGLSADTHTLPQTSTTQVTASVENKTYVGGVLIPGVPPIPVATEAHLGGLGTLINVETVDVEGQVQVWLDDYYDPYTQKTVDIYGAPPPLPFDFILPVDPDGLITTSGTGYLQNKSYVHHSGVGIAETGIKVYYLSPTEKRCVWGVANLPSIHLNEVQTYTYGSDDPATAEQLKGVGADGLLLNIYVV
jgi:hypothetical protein